MRLGFPQQTDDGECRVGLTPDVAKRYAGSDHELVVERGAGAAAGFTDADYEAAGCTVTDTVWDCDAVVAVRRPDEAALAQMRPGAILVGLLAPLDEPNAIRDIATSGVTAMSFETLPRTTRAQSMDVLSSQATLAGYQMVIEAATRSRAYCP